MLLKKALGWCSSAPDLFFLVLAFFLEAGDLAAFLFLELSHLVKILGGHGPGNEIREEDLLSSAVPGTPAL